MTGGGRGFCILKMPENPDEPATGIAGQTGRFVCRPAAPGAEKAYLRSQARRIEAALQVIRNRMEFLSAGRRRPAGGNVRTFGGYDVHEKRQEP